MQPLVIHFFHKTSFRINFLKFLFDFTTKSCVILMKRSIVFYYTKTPYIFLGDTPSFAMAEENTGKEEIREFLKILRPENIENVLKALCDDAQCDEMECVIHQDSDEWKSVFKNAKLVVAQQRKLLSEVNKLRKSNKMDPLSMKDSVWNNTSKLNKKKQSHI
ncbi:hypothetical protein RFI_38445 [Reticulomyxa filosa]|uniref:Uncharacterized protein n=1 Tax=Reticulomyxa filosa TaxID=46433 RepID=X6LAJ4_RETFI|nr:hypothetical protein RFI_38445 [Reticulomyxa filosa]|eukprot:ETN99042.1 hypothetical protein RFI_38445 [Reticulomyxa filosa]